MAKKLPEIPKEELYKAYIDENLSLDEMAKRFNRSPAVVSRALRKFGIRKPKNLVAEIRKRVNMEKYGVPFPASLQEFKDKIKQTQIEKYGCLYTSTQECKDRIKQTNMEKYGVECSLQCTEIREKGKETMKRKYGADSPLKCPEIKAKAMQTTEERYGTPYAMQSEEIREKQQETVKKRYNVENVSCLEWIKEKKRETTQKNYGVPYIVIDPEVRKKMIEDCKKKYGVEWYRQAHLGPEVVEVLSSKERLTEFILSHEIRTTMYLISVLGCTKGLFDRKIRDFGLRSLIDSQSSYAEKLIGDHLDSLGVKWEKTKQVIKPYEIDFYIPESKIGFEYNGSYWHDKNKKGTDYHLKKTILAKEKGVQLFHIYEYEWMENPEGVKDFITTLVTEDGEKKLKEFLDKRCNENDKIVSDISKENDDWYISRGFGCISIIPPKAINCNNDGLLCAEGEKVSHVVYNCGYKVWKRR